MEAIPSLALRGLGLRFVQQVTAGGRIYYGYRRGSFRVPLGNNADPVETLHHRYLIADEQYCVIFAAAVGTGRSDIFVQMRRSAASRAQLANLPCDITASDLRAMHTRQRGRCALTDLPFSLTKSEGSMIRPFAPSLDRLDNSLGYIVSNVRLACCMANLARNAFSDEEFYRMCLGAAKKHIKNRKLE